MPLQIAGTYNIHSLKWLDVPLCVQCAECQRRATIEADKLTGPRRHDMHPLGRLPLRCSSCGSAMVERWIPNVRSEAEAFLSGDIAPESGPATFR